MHYLEKTVASLWFKFSKLNGNHSPTLYKLMSNFLPMYLAHPLPQLAHLLMCLWSSTSLWPFSENILRVGESGSSLTQVGGECKHPSHFRTGLYLPPHILIKSGNSSTETYLHSPPGRHIQLKATSDYATKPTTSVCLLSGGPENYLCPISRMSFQTVSLL